MKPMPHTPNPHHLPPPPGTLLLRTKCDHKAAPISGTTNRSTDPGTLCPVLETPSIGRGAGGCCSWLRGFGEQQTTTPWARMGDGRGVGVTTRRGGGRGGGGLFLEPRGGGNNNRGGWGLLFEQQQGGETTKGGGCSWFKGGTTTGRVTTTGSGGIVVLQIGKQQQPPPHPSIEGVCSAEHVHSDHNSRTQVSSADAAGMRI